MKSDESMKCPKCGSEMEIPSSARRAVKGIWQGYWYCENCGHEKKVGERK